jgi:hypothetical protein
MALGTAFDVREEPSGRVKGLQLKWLNDGENILERDKRIELSPRPWQGRVLPLYESRVKPAVNLRYL